MHAAVTAGVLATCAYVLYNFLSAVIISFTRARRARQLGCGRPVPVSQPWWDLLGFCQLRATMAASKNKVIGDYFLKRHDALSEKAGFDVKTASVSILGKSILYTEDPKNIQAMLATKFKDFSLGSIRRGCFFPLLGNGIFTSDGAGWEHSRAMLRPSFAKERVSNLDLEERHNTHLYNAIPGRDNPDGWTDPVDLQTLFFRLTLDASTEFLFGESVDSQRAEMPDAQKTSNGSATIGISAGKEPNSALREINFAKAFDDAQDTMARRIRLGPRYWLIQPKKMYDDCAKCHAFIDRYVYKALAEIPERPVPQQQTAEASEKQQSIEDVAEDKDKSKYIFLHSLVQQTRDPIEIRSQLLHILLAGRDTTASLLGWLFALLARNATAYSTLRAAIIDSFGSDPTSDAQPITFASLKNCKHLQHTLREALRLYPVVPINSRVSTTETTLPTGGGPDGTQPVYVPPLQPVGYCVYAMHRNKAMWGPDADEFKPERWEGRKIGFEYLPFNAGPRICLGQNFALTSAGFAVVRLLQRFERLELIEDGEVGGVDVRRDVDAKGGGAEEASLGVGPGGWVDGVRGGIRQNATLTMRPDAGAKVRLRRAGVATSAT